MCLLIGPNFAYSVPLEKAWRLLPTLWSEVVRLHRDSLWLFHALVRWRTRELILRQASYSCYFIEQSQRTIICLLAKDASL